MLWYESYYTKNGMFSHFVYSKANIFLFLGLQTPQGTVEGKKNKKLKKNIFYQTLVAGPHQ